MPLFSLKASCFQNFQTRRLQIEGLFSHWSQKTLTIEKLAGPANDTFAALRGGFPLTEFCLTIQRRDAIASNLEPCFFSANAKLAFFE